jgi:hypothetical protein
MSYLHYCYVASQSVSCRNTEVDFVWSGLEETMLQSWDNVKCTAQERVCLETCMSIF